MLYPTKLKQTWCAMKFLRKIHWGAIFFTVINAYILAGTIDLAPIPKFKVTLVHNLEMSDTALITTLLACIGLLLTIFALFIAVLAYVGQNQIKIAAMSKAEEHVKQSITEDDGDLNSLVKKEVQELTYQHMYGTAIDDDWPENDEDGET